MVDQRPSYGSHPVDRERTATHSRFRRRTRQIFALTPTLREKMCDEKKKAKSGKKTPQRTHGEKRRNRDERYARKQSVAAADDAAAADAATK